MARLTHRDDPITTAAASTASPLRSAAPPRGMIRQSTPASRGTMIAADFSSLATRSPIMPARWILTFTSSIDLGEAS